MKIHGTAKGGALATKDFGVAFGGAAPCVEATYGQTNTNSGRIIYASRQGIAFEPESGNDIFEKTIKSVTFKLDKDSGSPDQTIYCRVRNSDGDIVGTFGSKPATGLPAVTPAERTFDDTQITLSSGDMITLEYAISSGDPIQSRIYAALNGQNYVSNAKTFVSDSGDITAWDEWHDGTEYFWMWFSCVYCE
jgi:hypothetical protein